MIKSQNGRSERAYVRRTTVTEMVAVGLPQSSVITVTPLSVVVT